MTPFLLANPNPHGPHYYPSRRGTVLAIVVHVTAGLEDLDGNDGSAEATARYAATTTRPVSWHSGSDTDSAFDLLPADYTAFHCQGYNSRTYGHEISKRTADWRSMAPSWIDATLHQAARHLAVKARELGVPLRHATRQEVNDAIARNGPPVGVVGHHQLDPARRFDPGLIGNVDTFPWASFLELVHRYQQPQQEDDMFTDEDRRLLQGVYGFAINTERVLPQIVGALDELRALLADVDAGSVTPDEFVDAFRARLAGS